MPNQEKKYYRNKIQIGDIEPDCLWELKQGQLILIDNDEYYALDASEFLEYFYKTNIAPA